MLEQPDSPSNNMQTVAEYIAKKKAGEEENVAFHASVEAIKARAAVDFNFFAGIVVPHLMRTLFPAFYLSLFALLTRINPDPYFLMRFALGLPRGFVKTTFLKILTCWLILHERNTFILVVGATESKALDFIAEIGRAHV